MSEQKRSEVVVITGASAGIGRATVREFARHGAHIGLLARGGNGLEGTRREVEEAGGRALVVPADIADPHQVETAAARVEEVLGPIDIWINDASVSVYAPFAQLTAAEFRRVTEVSYLGYVHGTMVALRRMLPRDRGTIVQVGSVSAYRGMPLLSADSGAKHAIQGFTESVRAELMHDGSKVWLTTVHLPSINTPQFTWVKARTQCKPQPIPPIYQPEVAARAIYYAAHHRRREMWVGAPTWTMILGNYISPRLMDRLMAQRGYRMQLYDGPPEPGRRDNLWEPVPGDFGAHGPFDERAMARSPQLWASTHRVAAIAGMVATLAAVATAAAGITYWVQNRNHSTGER